MLEENVIAAALPDVNDYTNGGSPPLGTNRVEEVSREPVPPATGPSEDDFFDARKATLEVSRVGKKSKGGHSENFRKSSPPFEGIALSWDSVPGTTV